jgi:DNA-binding GntR family transcriptional regulator
MAEPSKGGGILLGAVKAVPMKADKPKEGGSMSAARALISAVKSGDASAVDEALRLHYSLCESEDDAGEDE